MIKSGKEKKLTKMFSISGQLFAMTFVIIIFLLAVVAFYNLAFYKISQKRAQDYFDAYAFQLSTKISSTLSDIERFIHTLSYTYNIQQRLVADDIYARYRTHDGAVSSIDSVISSLGMLKDIQVLSADGSYISSSHTYTSSWSKMILSDISKDYGLYDRNLTESFFTGIYYDGDQSYFAYISPVYRMLPGVVATRNIGVVEALCNLNRFVDMLEDMRSVPDATFALSLGNDSHILSMDSELNRRVLAEISQGNSNSGVMYESVHNGDDYLSSTFIIEETGWEITYWFRVKDLMRDTEQMRWYGLIASCVIIFILTANCLVLYIRITRPIHIIARELRTLSYRNEGMSIPVPSRDEVGMIASDINGMLREHENTVKEYMLVNEQLHNVRLENKQAELIYYQKQINPHFLYNSLECIRSMADARGAADIGRICLALASVFRYSVSSFEYVPLKQELSSVRDYFEVMSYRFVNRYRLRIRQEPGTENAVTIKMLLQPILENCLTHAYGGESRVPILIDILCRRQSDGLIFIRISDNGRGMPPEFAEELNGAFRNASVPEGNKHIGLTNVNRRIQLNYGNKYGLSVKSLKGYYTCISIVLPFQDFVPSAGIVKE